MTNKTYRASLVIDGGFYRAGTSYYSYGQKLGWINPTSFVDLIQDEVASFFDLSSYHFVSVVPHFYDGQKLEGGMEPTSIRKMRDAGYKMHLTPLVKRRVSGGEKYIQKGVMESLIVDTLSGAFRDEYDVLVLVTGTKDLIPLVEAVKSTGKLVLIAYFDIEEWDDGKSRRNPTHASPDLLESGSDEINISEIINSTPTIEEVDWKEELFS